MSTTTDVPYRLELRVEVPGTVEQVWQAVATGRGLSAWYLPTELEEREGGAVHFTIGEEMGSDGRVTRWDPPHRLAFAEDWAALMGVDADALSPLTSEFLVEATAGGTCVVRVTASGFGTGADWEQEWWDGLAPGWLPYFEHLRLYLTHFAGQEATRMDVAVPHRGDPTGAWSALREAAGLGDEGSAVDVRGATGTVERVGEREALVRLTAPVPGLLRLAAAGHEEGIASAVVEACLFSPDAAEYVRREQPGWRAWLQGLRVPG